VVDLHSHVLPGIDDGPEQVEESLAMARVAARAGTQTLVATPHVRDDHPRVRPTEVRGRVSALQALVRQSEIALTVVSGGEVGLGRAMELPDEELREVTLGANDRDLLIETPFGELPSVFEDLVLGLAERGFRVTLAHPEHSAGFQRDPERLGRFVSEGVLVQVTASSFAASRRSRARGLAYQMLRRGWISAIASDSHSSAWRSPDMSAGLAAAGRRDPEATAELAWLVDAAPRAILAADELPPRPPRAPAKRRLWPRV